jgi:hypothetical protein
MLSEISKVGSHLAEPTSIWKIIAIYMSRIVFEV